MDNLSALTIREAAPEDYSEVAKIHVDVWRSAYKGILPDTLLENLSYENRLAMRESWLQDPQRFSLLAVLDGEMVGFCDGGPSRHRNYARGEIYAIYLRPIAQRSGIGRKLMESAQKCLKDLGLEEHVILALQANKTACQFYESLGYSHIETIPADIDGIIYQENVYVWHPAGQKDTQSR